MSEFPLETSLIPAEASLYSERLGEDQNKDIWIRTFLINHARNARGWAINPKTSRDKVISALKKPITIFRDAFSKKVDHPQWDIRKSAEANFKEQSKYAIGSVERVLYSKDNDSYYADCKITDPEAKKYINSFNEKKIPLPVSPQIIYNSQKEQPNYYSDWFFSHLAIVEKGAYGPDAKVLHVCSGDGDSCHKQFENTAAASAPDALTFSTANQTLTGKTIDFTIPNELGFCKTQALKDASASIFDTSHVTSTGNSNLSEMPDPMVEVKPDNSQALNKSPVKTDAENVQKVTLEVPVQVKPFFQDAPSINKQAEQQIAEQRKVSDNENNKKKDDNKSKEEGEGQNQEAPSLEQLSQRIAELEKQNKKLESSNQEYLAQKRVAEVANAVPQYLPEFLTDSGKFSQEKYNKVVTELANKPYSIEDIHFLYEPRVKAFEQNFQKSVGVQPNAEQMAQQAITTAPAKASVPEVYNVPDTKPAEASTTRKVPEFVRIPANGKERGRLA